LNNFDCGYDFLPVATAFFEFRPDTEVQKSDYVFKTCNEAFKKLFAMDVIGMEFSQIKGDYSELFKEIARCADENLTRLSYLYNNRTQFEIRLKPLNGEYALCISDVTLKVCGHDDKFCGVSIALKLISAGIITADRSGNVTFLNPAAKKLTGWNQGALGEPLRRVLDIHLEKGITPFDIIDNIFINGDPVSYGNNVLLKNKDGRSFNISLSISPVKTENGVSEIVVFFLDSSKDTRRQQEITYLSYHDKLTGLYNRAYFEKKMKEFDKPEYYPISIIIGDTNGLKMTNDVFGHRQGDILLVSIANILSLACRETDVIARYGGDEFTVLMPNTAIEEDRICSNILSLCNSQTFQQNRISISLGFASKESSSKNINDVLIVAEDHMYRHKLLESKSYRSSVISSLKKMLYEKSFETEEHAMRLTGLCNEAGRIMGLSQSDLNDLELFSMLHDIGKIGVNDNVLLKPGKLNEQEWCEMRRHSEIGYRIAQSAPELSHIAEYILCHHERWDGKGYPQGMKGKQIPLLSRILAVADSYDAMVNDRYYRKALSHAAAIEELKRCSGTQFDPDIVNVFLKILEPDPVEVSVPV
jgi:diguanylate cyclase (GGDEF)-like protein/PAS domain S-box-containing protein